MIILLGLLIIGVVYHLTSSALRDQFDRRAFAIATNLSDAAAARRKKECFRTAGSSELCPSPGVEYAFIEDGKGDYHHTLCTFRQNLKNISADDDYQQRRSLQARGKLVYEN
jgi:hypothetical protein